MRKRYITEIDPQTPFPLTINRLPQFEHIIRVSYSNLTHSQYNEIVEQLGIVGQISSAVLVQITRVKEGKKSGLEIDY